MTALKPTEERKLLGSYSDYSGIEVSVEANCAQDYLGTKMAQLESLSIVITHEEFAEWNAEIQGNIRSLINSLAMEIRHLIPLALEEVHQKALRRRNPTCTH